MLISIHVREKFLVKLFCFNTILAEIPELSILGKPRLMLLASSLLTKINRPKLNPAQCDFLLHLVQAPSNVVKKKFVNVALGKNWVNHGNQ